MQQFWPVPKRETSPELILSRFIQEVGSLLRADIEPENEKRVFSNFGSGVAREKINISRSNHGNLG